MVSRDMDRAIDRFLSASSRIRNGLITQRARTMQSEAEAPRYFEGEPHEYVDLSGTFENDLDYYIYEIGRARFIASAMQRPFGYPSVIEEAVAGFDLIVPHAKFIRDARTHPVDDDKLDQVVNLSGAVRLEPKPFGGVTYLVDPRYQHHEAALDLLDAIDTFLREQLRDSMTRNPPPQAARRSGESG